MEVHVLPGDAVAENFRETEIEGDQIICRECLIEGEVRAASLEDFWAVRAEFIRATHGAAKEEYFRDVAGELEKLRLLPSGSRVYLWFEYELFCQANMWFCLSLLSETEAEIYRVAPIVRNEEDVWKGFGGLSAEDLKKCFAERIRFGKADVALGVELWRAYQNADYEKLESLAENGSDCFPRLEKVCRAEIEKRTSPKQILREITESGSSDFKAIYTEFSRRAGVYGFGDAQVQRILAELKS